PYPSTGTDTVALTRTANLGAQKATTNDATITAANQPPVAGFTSSCTLLACNFTSTSSDPDGPIASYSWTFGDGATSATQNPSHSYGTGGNYTVTLTGTENHGGTNSTSKTLSVDRSPQDNLRSSGKPRAPRL